MKVTLIATIYNEEKSITDFLRSINTQTVLPDEVVIVDGGSTDSTLDLISKFISSNRNKLNIKIILKNGNRSVGRNEAIKNSKNNIIAITDAGCVLDKSWLKNITSPFLNKKVSVVAGYYYGSYENIFEKSIIPYVLIMPDKINPVNFLPATRSMAIHRSIWEKIGKFNEMLSNNEDYEFAKRLEKKNYKIYFQKSAIVYWQPVKNLKSAFRMFYRFALGDVESRIFRPKVSVIFLRYFYFIYLIFLSSIYKNTLSIFLIFSSILFYGFWSIKKNYKYVENAKAIYYLPILQCLSDVAVMIGSLIGLFKLVGNLNFNKIIKKYIQLILILFFYSISVFSIIWMD